MKLLKKIKPNRLRLYRIKISHDFIRADLTEFFLSFKSSWQELGQIGANKIVADLDAIKSEPVGFYLFEKLHIIKPLNVEEFMGYVDEYVNLMDLKNRTEVSAEELIEKYYRCFSKVIKTLTIDDVKNMSQQQCAALYELVMDTITGKVFTTEKKKLYHQKTEINQEDQLQQ